MEQYKTYISELSKYGSTDELCISVSDAENICRSAQQDAMMTIMDKIDLELRCSDGKIHVVDVIRIISSVHNKLNKV